MLNVICEKECRVRKKQLLIGVLLIFSVSVGYGAHGLSEEMILSTQKAFDGANTSKEISRYITHDFLFGIAGCKNGKFEGHMVPREGFLRAADELNAGSDSLKKISRKDQIIQLSKDRITGKSESTLIEESIKNGKRTITTSEEIAIYILEDGRALISQLMVEIKDRHYIEKPNIHITKPSSGCSR